MRDALCYQKRPFSWYQPEKLGVPINQLIARNFALSAVLAARMKRAIIREFFLSLNDFFSNDEILKFVIVFDLDFNFLPSEDHQLNLNQIIFENAYLIKLQKSR